MGDLPLLRQGRRDSALLVALEFAIIAALFVADWTHHIYFSKTPFLFLLGWISLRWRGLGWRDVGLSFPASWERTIVIGVIGGIGMGALEVFITEPLLVKITGRMPDLSALSVLRGNWKLLLLFVAIMWPLAAFGSQMQPYTMVTPAAVSAALRSVIFVSAQTNGPDISRYHAAW